MRVTDDKEGPPAHLISLPDPSQNMLPSQNSPLAVVAIQRTENTSARLRAKGAGSSLTLTPTPSNYCHQRYVTLQETHMEKPRRKQRRCGKTLNLTNSSAALKMVPDTFPEQNTLHKTGYDYRATCPSSKAFLSAPNLIQ